MIGCKFNHIIFKSGVSVSYFTQYHEVIVTRYAGLAVCAFQDNTTHSTGVLLYPEISFNTTTKRERTLYKMRSGILKLTHKNFREQSNCFTISFYIMQSKFSF